MITDPGKGEKDRQKRKDKRLKAWKIPKNKKETAFAERKAAWEAKNGG